MSGQDASGKSQSERETGVSASLPLASCDLHRQVDSPADVRTSRKLVYMMHPLGNASNRERNRKLACLWQAAVQEAHPEWLVLAPWIGLSGAWSEARRELGMQVDKATIDVCDMGIITGPMDGPMTFRPVVPEGSDAEYSSFRTGDTYQGISPGMADELGYFFKEHPKKKIVDLRMAYSISLPVDKPHKRESPYTIGQRVYVENKPGGECTVAGIDEPAPGVFRYLIERKETFFAHEQALKKADR